MRTHGRAAHAVDDLHCHFVFTANYHKPGLRGEIADHHLLFRSRGGGNARDNRITVCAWHHLRGIHQGRVRAWGTAPDAVTWELGTRPGQPPLLTLRGDRYVEGSELMA